MLNNIFVSIFCMVFYLLRFLCKNVYFLASIIKSLIMYKFGNIYFFRILKLIFIKSIHYCILDCILYSIVRKNLKNKQIKINIFNECFIAVKNYIYCGKRKILILKTI
ncbi:hypothetical protein EDEG_00082 [Edhazardia aedis USNM 41457]|uniref:Uncharacterized protein n=1 Tax=Edhazardia aedis (strain USNM 41457) TaxID=1003232 RepID=J9DQW7_EDHAE|nr:hypothetical protein EDEG_00082 [Edhazardia aedis USNM 41457]|eukprot:EJW04965.1 hypothetical protein EDEG_00082 [Edhazardia aedis USNM 41457]